MLSLALGLPDVEAEKNLEEDSHRPLMNGAENEDEYDPNYSIQEGPAAPQVKAISFCQACCLPGVIPVRTVGSPGTVPRLEMLQPLMFRLPEIKLL